MMERRRALDSEGYEMESDLISASSGGSMSDYGSDLEDIELELLRDKTRAHVIIRDTDRNNHYRPCGGRLQRQSAIDSILLSPGPTPAILITSQPRSSSDATFMRRPSCPSPHLLSPPLRRMSSPVNKRRQSKCTAQAVPDKIRQSSSSRIGANVRSSRRDIVLSSDNCDQPDGQDGVKKKKKKKKKDEEEEEEEESHIDPIPIVCAVFIASVFGGPVCLIANLKLGMFAAIGGGIMGYTTGKMFSDHGEQEAMVKGEFSAVVGETGRMRKHRQMRRIEEYEKFLTNCTVVKERLDVERERRQREQVKRRNTLMEGMKTVPEYSLLIRSKSLSYLDVIQTQGGSLDQSPKTERFSMPPLMGVNSSLNLQDKILIWQSCAGPYPPSPRLDRVRTASMRDPDPESRRLSFFEEISQDRSRRSKSLK